MRILVSAFGCAPNWGSEVAVGWNYVKELDKIHELDVIVESGFKGRIEEYVNNYNEPRCNFHFIDIGDEGRSLAPRQGNWLFYYYYRKWQLKVYKYVIDLMHRKKFDIIHHLNLTGYREPGFLWMLRDIPYVHGPISGFQQFPTSYLDILSYKEKIYELTRNVINYIQSRYHKRFINAINRADAVLAGTRYDQKIIKKTFGIDSIVVPVNGTFERKQLPERIINETINVIWIGKYLSRKALLIAIRAVGEAIKKNRNIYFHIVGVEEKFKKNVDLMINMYASFDNCINYGVLEYNKTHDLLARCDILFFTSLQDSTPSVIMEALTFGVPVVCHDIYGMGDVIDESCGVKISVIDSNTSIRKFSEILIELSNNKDLLLRLSIGAKKRSELFTWEKNAKIINNIYESIAK